ncbi:MAG: OmpA family protein [Paludibacter sp.]|nr:OmpA family protein [Paludibacter sp.]
MKKNILLFLLLCCFIAVHAGDLADRISKYGRWSVSMNTGVNRYDGDLDPEYDWTGILRSPNLGFSIDYNLHPNLAIGWSVDGDIFNQEDENEKFLSGNIATATYLSLDALGILRGKKSKKWSLWGSFGIGFGGSVWPEYATTRPFTPDPVQGVVFPPTYFIFPGTISLNYNLSKNYVVGLNVKKVWTNTDHMESIFRHLYKDVWQSAGFSLRYKFVTADKKHFRDEVFDVKDPYMTIINNLQQDVNNLSIRMDVFDNKLDNLGERFVKLEGILSNDGPDTDQDGVPDVRDLEPNTPLGTPVDFWGRSLGVKAVQIDDLLSVYFDFDSYQLDKLAQITIVKVANRMKSDPTLMLEIRGYTDNLGSGIYNQKLSLRRAERVKSELIKLHGIAHDRMVANGKGKIPNPPTKTLINRRCDFFFSK